MKLRYAALVLAIAPVFGAEIVKHPRDLKYPELNYQPPSAAAYRHKLASGATAYLVEDRALPLINIEVMVRTGKYLEPAGKTGLATLTGNLIRSGGTKTRPPSAFDEEAAFLAAQMNSSIGDTSGEASLNCLSRNIDACLSLFTDMLHNPGFEESRLKLAKAQTLQFMERRNDATEGIEQREFGRLLRGPTFFTASQPTKASIESITQADLAEFHSKYFYPANFIIAVSGDFATKDMMAKLDKALAGWANRTEAIPPVPKPDFQSKPGVYVVDKKGVNQGRVRLGHVGTTYNNPDHLALNVLNGILGGNGFTSRLMTRVRSDEGLAYSVGSIFQHGVYYDGAFVSVYQSKSSTVAQALAIVLEEVQRIRKEKVSEEEFNTEVRSDIEELSTNFTTARAKARRFATDDYEKRPDDYWQKYRARLQALTRDDLLRVAQKYLQPDKLIILVVGDADSILKGNPDKPDYQLAKFGNMRRIPLPDPMTMVYPAE